MRKLVMLGMVGLAAMATSSFSTTSHADDQGKWDGRIFRFEFNCSFDGHKADVTQPGLADGNNDRCTAHSTVYAYVRGDDISSASDVNAEYMNRMAVECGGHLIYADGALLDSGFRVVRILANNPAQLPQIIVPRGEHETFTADWMAHQAFLKLFRDRRDGTCQVRATPVRADGADIQDPIVN